MNDIGTSAPTRDALLRDTARYYSARIQQFGPSPEGVDWDSHAAQSRRFDQLLKVVDSDGPFSLLDYGCGYGALFDHLRALELDTVYCGFDIAPAMIAQARTRHEADPHAYWTDDGSEVAAADYAVASGVFNMKQLAPDSAWRAYVLDTLADLDRLAARGFAFNLLTTRANADDMRTDRYYAEPGATFDYCVRHFSPHVALLHDYGLSEFTVVVRKEPVSE